MDDVVAFLSGPDISEIPEILRYMNKDTAVACLSSWPAPRVAELISTLPAQVSARLLRPLDRNIRAAVFKACGERAAAPIRRLMQYPEKTAGALMDPNPPALPSDVDVSTARGYLSKSGSSETYYLYITDREGVLTGVCSIRDLFRSPPGSSLHQVMQRPVSMIAALAKRDSIIRHPGWQTYHSLPVVGNDRILLGVISYRILRGIEREIAAQGAEVPLFLAIGEMYWVTFVHLTEGLMSLLRPRNQRKDTRV
jgi:magnesium transporter